VKGFAAAVVMGGFVMFMLIVLLTPDIMYDPVGYRQAMAEWRSEVCMWIVFWGVIAIVVGIGTMAWEQWLLPKRKNHHCSNPYRVGGIGWHPPSPH
jgi:uncharacterized membrane protein